MSNSRKVTNRLVELMDEGMLSPEQLALMCLQYMSEDDVADMAQQNELMDLVEGGTYEPE
jgi:hypothetical protein